MVARVFETFWSPHTLNLGGSIFSLVCLTAFLSCGGRNPLRKYLFVYKDNNKEHEPIQRVLHWCMCALALNILFLLSGLPDVPVFILMADGDILETDIVYKWQDAAVYFAYWLTLDWVHFGIVFTLNSALTPKAITRTAIIGVGFACFSAGLTTLGLCLNYYLPAEVTSTFTMDAVDLLQSVLMLAFYIYWICQNRVRRSFGAFVWFNLIPNVLQFIVCFAALLGFLDETWDSVLTCRFLFRSAPLGLALVYAFHTDAKWFGTEAQVPEGTMFPKAFSSASFSRILKMLDKYFDLWVHVSELQSAPTEDDDEGGSERNVGGHGVVRQMELRAFICGPRQDVAVKFFLTARENYSEFVKKKDVDNISSELKFLLAAQGHRNIVKLHGFCLMPPQITLVTEWCGNGTLATPLGMSQRHGQLLPLALQCAKAVYWLHLKGILHRDLKPNNFLMQGNTVKLVDFGNACSFDDDLKTYVGGTPGYEAPEVIRVVDEKGNEIESKENIYSTKSDVFALGMVLWHIGACDQHNPLFLPKNAHDVSKNIYEKKRPVLDDLQKDMPNVYRNLVDECWAQDKNERPEAHEVVSRLKKMIRDNAKGTEARDPIVPDEWLRKWLGQIDFAYLLSALNKNGFASKQHILAMSEESLREIPFSSSGDRDKFREAVKFERRKAGLDGDLAGPLPFHQGHSATAARVSWAIPSPVSESPSPVHGESKSGDASPQVSSNAPSRESGNEPSQVSGNAPSRVSSNAPPRMSMSGSAPPRVSGNAPPRSGNALPRSGNAPPRVSGNAPPRVSGNAPPRVSGNAPPRVLDAPVALNSSRGLSGNAPPIVLVSSPATSSAPFFAPSE